MSRFSLIARGLDTTPLMDELAANPDLWGADPERMDFAESPFVGTDDIWVRGIPRQTLKTDRSAITRPHFCEFYPAWSRLPVFQSFVRETVKHTAETIGIPVALGIILVTRVPAGGRILPHADTGWPPVFMNHKVHLAISSNPGCVNASAGERFSPLTGDVFTFDNTLEHSVENNGDSDRIIAIITMRVEQ